MCVVKGRQKKEKHASCCAARVEDGGKAGADELTQCGWNGNAATRFWPVGGARFSSRWGRDFCFQIMLNDRWNGALFSSNILLEVCLQKAYAEMAGV